MSTGKGQLVPHWIAGRPVSSERANLLPVTNPATGEEIGQVELADQELVDRAVAAAVQAFPAWRETPPAKRVQILYRLRDLMHARSDEIMHVITTQHGKTLDDASGELARSLEALEMACGAPAYLKGTMGEQVSSNIDTMAVPHPLGVCLGISPFNFPFMLPVMFTGVATAAGNTVIIKPSEQDPAPAILFAELAAEAGFPVGVVNVVQGARQTVEMLIDHPDIQAVSFVGSSPVAHSIYQRSAAAGKRVQALGGAKNHLVVLPDANLEAAADALSSGAYGSSGQRCMAVTVGVLVGDVADRLVPMLADRARSVVMGDGASVGAEMGPLISADAQKRVRSLVVGAVEEGATAIVDRSSEVVSGREGGYFVGPTLLDHVLPGMEVYDKEVFGPVLSLVRVETYQDGLDLIERNPYGNGAALFTRDGEAARRFQREAAAGMVGINVPIPVPVATFGIAGWKRSVFGDTGLNDAAWRFFTRTKHVTTRWDDSRRGVDMGFRPM
jgi:malonate-semialdehyde dehydrogenase (acetylating) / methylmalonate-semialdehyde dehydrogenase